MIKTIIITPQKQDREKIVSLLSANPETKVLGHGKDGYDALRLVGSLKPDIAILDNHLEFIDGEEIPPLLRVRSPSTAVVIFVTNISDHQLHRAASNAVSGIINKKTDVDALPKILKCIYDGGCYISPVLASRVLNLLSSHNKKDIDVNGFQVKKSQNKALEVLDPKSLLGDDPAEYLSKMELQILVQIGEGYASDEIAKNLKLAVGTVRNYISSVMRKTGLQSRSQMVRYAFCYGLVPLNPAHFLNEKK
jgi:two-component system nitrate/nitrite response regulator NarL